jgi:hypothetical protein
VSAVFIHLSASGSLLVGHFLGVALSLLNSFAVFDAKECGEVPRNPGNRLIRGAILFSYFCNLQYQAHVLSFLLLGARKIIGPVAASASSH